MKRRHEYPSERYERMRRQANPDGVTCREGACVWPASCKHLALDGKIAICARTWKAPTRILPPEPPKPRIEPTPEDNDIMVQIMKRIITACRGDLVTVNNAVKDFIEPR